MTVEIQKRWCIRLLFWGLIALGLYLLLQYVAGWLFPFLIGILCAFLLQKPIGFLTKFTPIPRGGWAFLLVGLLASLLFWAVGYGGYILYDRLFLLVEKAAELVPQLSGAVSKVLERFSSCAEKLPPALVEKLRTTPAELAEQATQYLSRLLTDTAANVVMHLPALLLAAVVSVAASIFITADYPAITAFLRRHTPQRWQPLITQTKQIFTGNILKLLRGYLLVMGLTFIQLFFGLLILGIPYASTLALLIAVVDILPVLGTGTVLLPWGIIALFVGNTKVGIGVLVLYGVITIVRNILEPKIIGKQVGLPPLVTLLSLYLGLNLFGFVGLWGVPLLLILGIHLYRAGAFAPTKNRHP